MATTQPQAAAGWRGLTAESHTELVRFAQARLGRTRLPGVDAEDVVQEVLLRMVDRGSITATGGSGQAAAPHAAVLIEHPAAYLRRAVANECVTRWRRLHREVLTGELPEATGGDHAEARTSWLAAAEVVRELSPRQQQIIIRGFLLDQSDETIATDLGISPVTVRTMRRRALLHLRQRLSDGAESEPLRATA